DGPLSALLLFMAAVGGAAFLILFNTPLLTVLAFVALWAYPLAARLWRYPAERSRLASWAFLDAAALPSDATDGRSTPSFPTVRAGFAEPARGRASSGYRDDRVTTAPPVRAADRAKVVTRLAEPDTASPTYLLHEEVGGLTGQGSGGRGFERRTPDGHGWTQG